MNSYLSNLDYIMDILKISGKDISRHLDIDNSLVSKWKNNKRPLTMHTSHLEKLAEYIVEYKKGVCADTIKGILSEYYPDKSLGDKKELLSQLMFWLTEKYDPIEYKSEFTDGENYIVFCGNDGRREAVLIFLDEILKQNTPQNLMLISQEEMSWILEDTQFLTMWKEKLVQILLKGNTINIIHWVDRSTGSLSDIIGQWLPLYLTGNIKSWYLPRYSESLIKSTLFLAENTMAIAGMEGKTTNDRYTTLLRDALSLKHYTWVFENIRSKCHPLVHVFSFPKDNHIFINELKTLNPGDGDYISLSNFPGFYTMPEDMLVELLDNNDVENKAKSDFLDFYSDLRRGLENKSLVSIYTKDGIKKALEDENYIYLDLSLMMGKNISADRNFVRKHIRHILKQAEKEKEGNRHQVGLMNSSVELNSFINSEGFAFTWNPERSSSLVLATESNVVAAFYNQLLSIWESIPRINKAPEILKKKFQEQIY